MFNDTVTVPTSNKILEFLIHDSFHRLRVNRRLYGTAAVNRDFTATVINSSLLLRPPSTGYRSQTLYLFKERDVAPW